MGDMYWDNRPLANDYLHLTVKLGFHCPYLMDEVLALAAAHKSTMLQGASQYSYRREATQLQTRAVAQFNATDPVTHERDPLSIFFFSSLLGQHVLYDTFSSEIDLPSMLDQFVHCLGLHRGIRTIVSRSFPSILAQLREHQGPDSVMERELLPLDLMGDPGDECATLTRMLRQYDFEPSVAEVYRQAVDALQRMFDTQRDFLSRRHIVVQEWPVRVSQGYVGLLAQRRPEALVILAYYGLLLHYARHYWAVAGAGRFLIQSITTHLGSYWYEWLEMPNRMLEALETFGT